MSPIIPFEGILSDGGAGILCGSLILISSVFVLSIIFGRVFCGWVCPAGAFQESFCSYLNSRNVNRKIDIVKFFVWAPWFAGIVVSFITVGGIKSVDFFFNTYFGRPFSIWGIYVIIYMIVSLLILIGAGIFGRRGSCHLFCWISPFMIIGRKLGRLFHLPQLSLKADADRCVSCGICSKQCPMSLDVKTMAKSGRIYESECILCGACADSCPKNVIRFTLSR
jgi:polyferredoxin